MIRTKYAIVVLAAVSTSLAQQAQLEAILARIAKYEYGQTREPLAQFTVLVEQSLRTPAAIKRIESALLQFLQSGATAAGKDFALRQLSLIGTDASVPVLTGMLTKPETAEMARYALARIPGAAADEALRRTLAKTSGAIQIGIINSLGQRRDAKSVGVLRPLLISNDRGVAEAAAAALSEIASESALITLSEARTKANASSRQRITEAYLRCAGELAARGNKPAALKVYKELIAPQEPERIRISALGGWASLEPAGAVPALTAELESKSPELQAVAIRLLSAIPGSQITNTLIQQFPKMPASGQVRLLAALADRGDAAARPLFLATYKEEEVRAAALSGLGKLGDGSSVMFLAEAAAASQGATQAAARSALYALRGPDIDQAIVSALGTASGQAKIELIMAAGERGTTAASDVLSKAVDDSDPVVHREALKALRNVAGPDQVPALLKILVESKSASDRREATQALASLLKRSESASVDPIVSTYKSAGTPAARVALLEVMGQTSREEVLPVLRSSLKDPAPEIARAAILALSEWATPAPMADLLAIARSDSNPTLQVLALRGYLKLLGLPSQRPASEGAKMLAEAMQLAKQPAEKRTVLSLLPAFPSKESLQLAEAATKDQDVAKEAKAAVTQLNGLLKFQ